MFLDVREYSRIVCQTYRHGNADLIFQMSITVYIPSTQQRGTDENKNIVIL